MPLAPVISSANLIKNVPNITNTISTGYESINTAMSGVAKQVFPSYQQSGYMFNKIVADPLYGEFVRQRTGLLPSENWIATTSPGAMTTGGFTKIVKNADGSETRTKYGFNTDGSIASNVMQGITGFAEGGWNMPRERPLDTALILASGGAMEAAAGTAIGSRLLAAPAARYVMLGGLGMYGGDVGRRVYGDDGSDRTTYGMAKRLGGITTTELIPSTVVLSPIVKSIAVRTPTVKNFLVSRSRNAHMASDLARKNSISISDSDMKIIRASRPGEPERMSGHSSTMDVGYVTGESNSIPTEIAITQSGVPDGKGGIVPGTSFIGKSDLKDVTILHTHPVYEYTHDITPEVGTIVADSIPSGNDVTIHLLNEPSSRHAVGVKVDSQTGYIVTKKGSQTPWERQGGDSRFVDIPRVSSGINKVLGVVDTISPRIAEKISPTGGILSRAYNAAHKIETKIVDNLNQDMLKDLQNDIRDREFAIKTYRNALDLTHRTVFRGVATPSEISSYDFVNRMNKLAQSQTDALRNTLSRFGGGLTVHKVNLKTGEQQLVDYPIIARSVPVKGAVEKLIGVKYRPDYHLPAPAPVSPVVYNKPATSVSEIKQLIESKMPTVKDGYTRLYRVDPVPKSTVATQQGPLSEVQKASRQMWQEHADRFSGRWFSGDLEHALWYWNFKATDMDIPKLSYVDVPTKDVAAYRVSNIPVIKDGDASFFMDNPAHFSLDPTAEFYIPKPLAQQKEAVLTATKQLHNIGLIFPETLYPGPRKQRYTRKKKSPRTKKKKVVKKKTIINTPRARTKKRATLSTGTRIEKRMSRNVNRFLGW